MNLTKVNIKSLLRKPHVNLIYEKDWKLIIGVEIKTPYLFPSSIQGMSVKVIETGVIQALYPSLPSDLNRTDKWRPAPGGVSIGHVDITAGTMGMIVRKDGKKMILSNNHVLANSNYGKIGDSILQPGPYDISGGGGGPCPFSRAYVGFGNLIAQLLGSRERVKRYRSYEDSEYLIGYLHQFVPIDFSGGYNRVDAALALPISDELVRDDILEIGILKKFSNFDVGDIAIKSGRTTGLNQGTVTSVDAIVKVNYGNPGFAIFEHQIVIEPAILQGGDSGSKIVKEDKKTGGGLGFAGSDKIGIANNIEDVLKELGGFSAVG